MISVRFYGRLKDDFGGRFLLDAQSPREALHALFVQIDGLREQIRNGFYKVRWRGKRVNEADAEQVLSECADGCLQITPVAGGAGRAAGIIAGIVILIIAWWNPGGWFGAAAVSGMYAAGIGLVVGGVAQLLTKQPKMEIEERAAKAGRNTAFSNLSNTDAQGRPVPLAFGKVYCGSRVISQGVESRRLGEDEQGRAKAAAVFHVERRHYEPVPAAATETTVFDSDITNDSVRARNYTAKLHGNSETEDAAALASVPNGQGQD